VPGVAAGICRRPHDRPKPRRTRRIFDERLPRQLPGVVATIGEFWRLGSSSPGRSVGSRLSIRLLSAARSFFFTFLLILAYGHPRAPM
jgi:hypothetical protein